MPADARQALAAIEAAVLSGRLDRAQLEASAERRRAALDRVRPAPGDPRLAPQADGALEETLVRLTLETTTGARPRRWEQASDGPGINLVRVDTALQAPFLPPGAPALATPTAAGLTPCLVDGLGPGLWGDDPAAPLELERLGSGPVLVQLFVRGNPFRGSAGGEEPWPAAIAQLVGAGRLAALAVYGSPYVWAQLRPLVPATVPAAYSPGQMPRAQRAVLEALGLGHTGDQDGFTD
jgi:beta-glucosidase